MGRQSSTQCGGTAVGRSRIAVWRGGGNVKTLSTPVRWEETAMRLRDLVALGLVALPAALGAQRIPPPRLGGRGPTGPTELPPQPVPVARAIAYQRLRTSVEAYPIVSYIDAPGYGAMSHWTTFGGGSRVDYRVSRMMSATLDLTSSFLGGPAYIQTAELGTRF